MCLVRYDMFLFRYYFTEKQKLIFQFSFSQKQCFYLIFEGVKVEQRNAKKPKKRLSNSVVSADLQLTETTEYRRVKT